MSNLDEYCELLKQCANKFKLNFYTVGEVLNIVFNNRLHFAKFDNKKQLIIYCGLKYASAFQAYLVWKNFGQLDIENISPYRLICALKVINRESKDTILNNAKTMRIKEYLDWVNHGKS